jgi:hypothetical protein
MNPILIKWLDTVGSSDWSEADDIDVKVIEQVGWVVYQDKAQIKIADTKADDSYYGITAIPRGCVIEVSGEYTLESAE